jgi:NDP-sugar pyrophosphorylase family protein
MFRVSDERSQLLGSGGGVRQAYELFSSDPKRKGKAFFLLNADMLLDMNLQDLEEHHEFMRDHYGVRMTLVIFSKAPGRLKYTKIVIDDIRGLIRSLGEPISGGPFYVGAAIIEPDALERLNPGEIAGFTEKILEPAIRAGRAGALIYDTSREDSMSRSWYDVGDPESWRLTQLELLSRLRNYSLPARWEQRLRLHVRDLGEGVFVSSRSSLLEKPSSWEGPCFWSPLLPSDAPPTRMHEGSVVYGSGIEVGPHSIAYGDLAFSTEAEPHS